MPGSHVSIGHTPVTPRRGQRLSKACLQGKTHLRAQCSWLYLKELSHSVRGFENDRRFRTERPCSYCRVMNPTASWLNVTCCYHPRFCGSTRLSRALLGPSHVVTVRRWLRRESPEALVDGHTWGHFPHTSVPGWEGNSLRVARHLFLSTQLLHMWSWASSQQSISFSQSRCQETQVEAERLLMAQLQKTQSVTSTTPLGKG